MSRSLTKAPHELMASRSTHELYALYAGVLAAKALGGSADSDITGDMWVE